MRTNRAIMCLWRTLLVVGIAVGVAGLVTAQGDDGAASGGIQGRLLDVAGDPVEGATITIVGADGIKQLTTTADGLYRFTGLTAGAYITSADAEGYEAVRHVALIVASGANVSIGARMHPEEIRTWPPPRGDESGPYHVVPVTSADASSEQVQEFLNSAHGDGFELIALLPANGADEAAGALYLLALRERDASR